MRVTLMFEGVRRCSRGVQFPLKGEGQFGPVTFSIYDENTFHPGLPPRAAALPEELRFRR